MSGSEPICGLSILAIGTAMRVFVVMTHYVGGRQAERVFTSEKAAQAYISKRKDEGGSPTIEEFPVQGRIETEDLVYITESYDEERDIFNLEGLYGNYTDAKRAAEEYGVEHGGILQKEVYLD
jgi:hypothetical protein